MFVSLSITLKGRSTLCVQNFKIIYARTSRVSTLYKTALTSVTAYSVGGHNTMLNWMTEITDL